MPWRHPTYLHPTTVSLIALGPSYRDYVAGCMEPEPPGYLSDADEVWTVNRGGMVFSHNLLWVMDHVQGEADKHPIYGKEIWNHNKPVITSQKTEGWKDYIHEYPFSEIEAWLLSEVKAGHADWFHNSLAYIIVYAAFIGVRTLNVWGADYVNHRNGVVEEGHPNVAYWVGVMERMGLTVKPISSSSFLGANQRSFIYGYRDDPRASAVERRNQFQTLISPITGELMR